MDHGRNIYKLFSQLGQFDHLATQELTSAITISGCLMVLQMTRKLSLEPQISGVLATGSCRHLIPV